MLYRLLQLRTISVSAVFVIVIARRKEKEEHSTFVFFAFIEYRLPRFGRKYYALLFDFFRGFVSELSRDSHSFFFGFAQRRDRLSRVLIPAFLSLNR